MNDYFAVDWGETGTAAAAFKVVLINPYELGRQSFNLAAPAALLKAAGWCSSPTIRPRTPSHRFPVGVPR